jgi:hypothetical protein
MDGNKDRACGTDLYFAQFYNLIREGVDFTQC